MAQSENTRAVNNVYLNVITQKAAQAAGVSVGANGVPRINNAAQADAYNAECSRIYGAFWCQTGGWWPDGDNTKCAPTAIATCASINLGVTITPSQVDANCNFIDGVASRTRNDDFNATYESYEATCNNTGLNYYNFSSEEDILDAINNELSKKRSVVVKTNYAGQHWVTITGTRDGAPADSFSDFIGVDPWYNGLNPNNPNNQDECQNNNGGWGGNANNTSLSGIFYLTNNNNQTFHSDYAMFSIV